MHMCDQPTLHMQGNLNLHFWAKWEIVEMLIAVRTRQDFSQQPISKSNHRIPAELNLGKNPDPGVGFRIPEVAREGLADHVAVVLVSKTWYQKYAPR